MSILLSWLSPLRAICMAIDGIAFSLLDNAYNIVIELSKAQFMSSDEIKTITDSLYILFGVVAFFRLAMVLITSIIDPEKMNEKGKGLGNIFLRVVGMFILLGITPWLFKQAYIIQGRIVGSDANQNVIFQLFLGDIAKPVKMQELKQKVSSLAAGMPNSVKIDTFQSIKYRLQSEINAYKDELKFFSKEKWSLANINSMLKFLVFLKENCKFEAKLKFVKKIIKDSINNERLKLKIYSASRI